MTDAPPERAWFAKADQDLAMARREDEARSTAATPPATSSWRT